MTVQTGETPVPAAQSPASAQPASLRAEIIAVGTELLMGEVINSNAGFLSKALADVGIDVYYHTAVGDNPGRIKGVFEEALKRSNLLLVTGGLGPTDDDLTVSTLAELLDTSLVSDPESEERIRQFFITRDMPMSPTNLKQAKRPVDGEPLFNRMGTAPGLFWDVTDKVAQRGWGSGPRYILAFPGVPREMKVMWAESAIPRLEPLLPHKQLLVCRFLKFFGLGESMLGEKLRDLMAQESPTVSPYVGQAEVKLRIAVKADTREAGLAQIQPVEDEILRRVGNYCFGRDDDTLESAVGTLLRERHETVAVAESCTGGLVSSRLTDVSGSSDYILENVVTYSNTAKQNLLNVASRTLLEFGAVSGQVAAEMAQGIIKLTGADVGLAITGIAGPTGSTPEKPVGLAYIAVARDNGQCPLVKKITVNPQYEREYIKYWFSQYALHFCRLYLLDLLDAD